MTSGLDGRIHSMLLLKIYAEYTERIENGCVDKKCLSPCVVSPESVVSSYSCREFYRITPACTPTPMLLLRSICTLGHLMKFIKTFTLCFFLLVRFPSMCHVSVEFSVLSFLVLIVNYVSRTTFSVGE